MRPLTVEELRALLAKHESPCISLYMPTSHASPAAPKENRLRYEGLLKKARELVGKQGGASAKLLDPMQSLANEAFWKRPMSGLAVFQSPTYSASFQVPIALPEKVVVAESFHVRPLVRAMHADQRYFLLNLSQGSVSFYNGSASGVTPIDLASLPKSLTDALGLEDRGREVNFHSSGAHGSMPIFHGQAKSDTSRDEDLLRFFRIIDQALWEVLRDDKAPLVVAAPERLLPMYRSVSRYAHIAQDGVRGNFDGAKLEELHARAWPIVQKQIRAREDEVLQRYERFTSTRRTVDEINDVALAAVEGRVLELLLDKDASLRGKVDVESGRVQIGGDGDHSREDDVLDDIAEAVILRGGDVYAFEKKRMPSKSPIAATMRW